MGICIHAKEIIYSSKICNVPVVLEENRISPHNNNDNTNDNSANNNNDNNNNNTTNIKNINLQNNININLNVQPKVEEKKRRSILLVKKEIKLQEAAETKLENEEEEKNEKNEKHEKKNKKDHFKKKVAFQPNKDQEINSNVEPEEKSKEKLHKRKRGHSINTNKKIKFDNIIESENKSNNENQEKTSKFQRSKKKYATLKDKAPRLDDKLKGIENKIPVMQETLVTQKFGDPDKYYKKIKDLGSGSYGAVYLAKNVVMDNIVAIKSIEKTEDNMVDDLEIKNEINILKKLSHPNIVKIYEFFDTILYYYLVTEYCKKGELFSYIKNRFSERQLAVLFYQVFSGLCYLHEKKIIHRDLKLENIMVSDVEKDVLTGEEYFWIKIIDFGTAKIFEKNKTEKSIIGSSYYIAPEVLRQKYNEKCDTWSVGVILYMTLVGVAPFDGRTDEEIIHRIKTGKYNKKNSRFVEHSEEVKDLVYKLLEMNTEKRYSAKEALNHPWFQKYGGRNLFNNFKQEDIKPYIENLFNYKYNSKLQELVIAFLVHNISNNYETLIILKMFRHFNKSGDCKLTKKELTLGLYDYKEKEDVDEMVDIIFQRLDGDNNGYIEYEEFLRACIDKKHLMTRENLKYAFKFLDKDNSRTLNAQKIISAFLAKSNKEFEAIFNIYLNEVDKDGDGIIDFNQFCLLMTKIQ
jgi:calcium-dependent protein kinase